ncbi:MAG: hypothetical protein WAS73_07700 [Defluviicoccus sp.]
MQFDKWKNALVNEIEVAAEWRAEKAVLDRDDPRIRDSQQALFDLAHGLKALPADHAGLCALFQEEQELGQLDEAGMGAAESRYREAKEDLLQAIGFEHDPFPDPAKFLDVLRRQVDETITEFRLA